MTFMRGVRFPLMTQPVATVAICSHETISEHEPVQLLPVASAATEIFDLIYLSPSF